MCAAVHRPPLQAEVIRKRALPGMATRLASGAVVFAEFLGAEEDALAHDLAGLELDGGAGRDDDVGFGFVGVATYAGFGQADLKDTEVSQLDIVAIGEVFRDVVEGFLDHGKGLLLGDANILADFHDHVAFGEICHKEECFVQVDELKDVSLRRASAQD
jgi:hypothetical protein